MKNCKSLIFGCILAVLALPLVGAVNVASAQNILGNGDFETGDLTDWTVAGGNEEATVMVVTPGNGPSLPGVNHAFMNNTGEALGLTLKQTTAPGTATGGTVYYLLDVNVLEAEVGGVVFYEIFAEAEGMGIVGGSGLNGPFFPSDGFVTFSGDFEAPANTSFLTMQVVAATGANAASTCVVQVDNVALTQGEAPVASEASSWSNVKAMYR